MSFDLKDLRRRMAGVLKKLKEEYAGLRTGRASAGMLEPIKVDVYGSKMPMNQVGSISVPEARLLTVQVWDANNVKMVEKAIRESGLGLNPQPEGTLIRVPVPALSEERRKEMSKIAGKYAEEARIAVRNVRRDGMDSLKKMEKNSEISEDQHKRMSDQVQDLTDEYIGKIDQMLEDKDNDIMTV